ncbi:hypothetical protein Pcinc_009508 [Petrolisthes cinctipes]|uniref:Uncharacterized protein n=1 Tax=Petrolisthes cinctipes TaxID=88211 RepID=A0AAE1G506_PETCI|nr:hypothetical protein Pcinc_009508 [Petrolisthes cinctipes]
MAPLFWVLMFLFLFLLWLCVLTDKIRLLGLPSLVISISYTIEEFVDTFIAAHCAAVASVEATSLGWQSLHHRFNLTLYTVPSFTTTSSPPLNPSLLYASPTAPTLLLTNSSSLLTPVYVLKVVCLFSTSMGWLGGDLSHYWGHHHTWCGFVCKQGGAEVSPQVEITSPGGSNILHHPVCVNAFYPLFTTTTITLTPSRDCSSGENFASSGPILEETAVVVVLQQ